MRKREREREKKKWRNKIGQQASLFSLIRLTKGISKMIRYHRSIIAPVSAGASSN